MGQKLVWQNNVLIIEIVVLCLQEFIDVKLMSVHLTWRLFIAKEEVAKDSGRWSHGFQEEQRGDQLLPTECKGGQWKNYCQLNAMGEGREGFLRIVQSLIRGSSSYHGDTNKILHTLWMNNELSPRTFQQWDWPSQIWHVSSPLPTLSSLHSSVYIEEPMGHGNVPQ